MHESVCPSGLIKPRCWRLQDPKVTLRCLCCRSPRNRGGAGAALVPSAAEGTHLPPRPAVPGALRKAREQRAELRRAAPGSPTRGGPGPGSISGPAAPPLPAPPLPSLKMAAAPPARPSLKMAAHTAHPPAAAPAAGWEAKRKRKWCPPPSRRRRDGWRRRRGGRAGPRQRRGGCRVTAERSEAP